MPVASPCNAACHRTGRNSTRPINSSSRCCLKCEDNIWCDIIRKSSTVWQVPRLHENPYSQAQLRFHNGEHSQCLNRNNRKHTKTGIQNRWSKHTTFNNVPKSEVTGWTDSMDNEHQMVNLCRFSWNCKNNCYVKQQLKRYRKCLNTFKN